jgi:hypothetical protein
MAMTTTSTAAAHPVPRTYRSPLHALVWSFRKSRDNWKRKYLDVKAQLKGLRRRFDRLTKAHRPSPPPTAPSSKPVAVVSPPPACLAAVHRVLLDLRQQVQANRELLEQRQQQSLELLDLARRLQQLAADRPPPVPPPPTPAPNPLSTASPQAPPEPKKGAPGQRNG